MKNLSTGAVALILVLLIFGAYLLDLPEGAPRFVAAGLITAVGVGLYIYTHRGR